MNHRESASKRVIEALDKGFILTAYDSINRKETSCGPYRTAVEGNEKFAVFGKTELTFSNSYEASEAFINLVGYPRAREAVDKVLKGF